MLRDVHVFVCICIKSELLSICSGLTSCQHLRAHIDNRRKNVVFILHYQ